MSGVLSLNPDDAVQGGLLDDADVIIKSARCDFFTYNNGTTAVGGILEFEDGDGKVHEQFYAAGGKTPAGEFKIVPNEEKNGLVPADGVTVSGLAKNSNLIMFLASLKEAGYNTAGLADITKLAGVRVHVNRKALPKQANAPADEKERSILLVTKILEAKGKGGSTKAASAPSAGKPATTAPAAPAAAANPDLDSALAGMVFEILMGENGNTSPIKALAPKVFQKAKADKNPDALKLSQRVAQADFLASRSEFTVAGDKVSVAA